MQKPTDFYSEQLDKLKQQLTEVNKKISTVRLLRFIVFISLVIGIYYTFNQAYIPVIIGVIGIVVFSFLVVKHQTLKEKRKIIKHKISINQTEINVSKGDFSNLPNGAEFIDSQHFYSYDIDLFGENSFFQYINRTITSNGKKLLAKIVSDNSISHIQEKQKSLQELSQKVNWRQHFSSLKTLISSGENDTRNIVDWMTSYESKLSQSLINLARLFSIVSILLIGLVSFKVISFSVIINWFFIGLAITAFNLKKTQKIYTSASKSKDVFKQYYVLLEQVEKETFSSKILKEKQKSIQTNTQKASLIFKEFSKILDAFDQRNNVIIAVFGNGLFLWEVLNACKAEKWINNHKNTVEEWFNTISFFDAYNSLANFVFNKPQYVFPTIQEEHNNISANNLGHPLLNPLKRVDNNFTIQNGQFFIVTGANMAGKSTFLRTVSLSIIMANCGLPVCAESYKYTPTKLITSMRTSDSLSDDESYFYSELKRLKLIVNTIESDNYFIILDEILKGTNSKDKAIGSKQFVEKLNKSNSTGIIATHDVSLCDLADEYHEILNYYFDAEIVNDELYFDYKMKTGVCKNMNASFLLRKMEIV
ncbi:MutS-related protein, family 1 [Tenacibaculum sp. 190524A02b]|uniref:MutS-related protein n=1 Tax=Tenacibaculum vairaonense TaxID=3137860 RepID=UPI0032B1652E